MTHTQIRRQSSGNVGLQIAADITKSEICARNLALEYTKIIYEPIISDGEIIFDENHQCDKNIKSLLHNNECHREELLDVISQQGSHEKQKTNSEILNGSIGRICKQISSSDEHPIKSHMRDQIDREQSECGRTCHHNHVIRSPYHPASPCEDYSVSSNSKPASF